MKKATNKTASERVKVVRAALADKFDYLRTELFTLQIKENPNIPTMDVNKKWVVQYNPEFVDQLSDENIAFIIMHELLHVINNTFERTKPFERISDEMKQIATIAEECALNSLLEHEFKIPYPQKAGGLRPETFGMKPLQSLEEYILELIKKPWIDIKNIKLDPNTPGQGCETKDSNDSSEGITEIEAQIIRNALRERLAQRAKTIGDVPGGLLRELDIATKHRVNWRTVLRTTIKSMISTKRGLDDFTMTKTKQRYGVILPKMVGGTATAGIVIDTSGSIDQETLAQAMAECKEIIRSLETPCWVLSCDTQVNNAKKIYNTSGFKLIGEGGTDMRKGIEEAEKKQVDVIVVLTDGYTPWPEKPPKVPVVIGLIDSDAETPAWAKCIKISEDRIKKQI